MALLYTATELQVEEFNWISIEWHPDRYGWVRFSIAVRANSFDPLPHSWKATSTHSRTELYWFGRSPYSVTYTYKNTHSFARHHNLFLGCCISCFVEQKCLKHPFTPIHSPIGSTPCTSPSLSPPPYPPALSSIFKGKFFFLYWALIRVTFSVFRFPFYQSINVTGAYSAYVCEYSWLYAGCGVRRPSGTEPESVFDVRTLANPVVNGGCCLSFLYGRDTSCGCANHTRANKQNRAEKEQYEPCVLYRYRYLLLY